MSLEGPVPGSGAATLRLADPPWRHDREAGRVLGALDAAGIEARFVGGAVRNSLIGRPVTDFDLATPARPDAVAAAAAAAGLKVVPTGLAHGTVTVFADGRPVEITTLRRDAETDGRHAVVAFTTEWAADAARRDFTMNALFANADGRVWDFVDGIPDALAGRVRFVGDPERRIREDVLRLLRFWRFQAWYGRGAPDGPGRAATARLAPLLPGLSGERVRAELLRLLEAPDPVPSLAAMLADGVLAPILPEARDLERLARVVAGGGDGLLRLGALLPDQPELAAQLAESLRLSGRERERLAGLLDPRPLPAPLPRALYRLGRQRVEDRLRLMGAWTEAAASLPIPVFPLKGRDLLALGAAPGPGMKELLARVEAWWEAAGYAPDPEACRAEAARLLAGPET